MMNMPMLMAVLLTGSAAAVMIVLLRKLSSPHRDQTFNTDWLSRFSIARYRPMQRILAEDDYRFLEAQECYHPSIASNLRRKRAVAFRSYLTCLKADFGRLDSAIRLYMAACSQDRPDLAQAVLKRRLVFAYALTLAEWRLLLFRFGLGTVDIEALIGSLDGMRLQLGQMALARQASIR
jgi:hypothetical protein